MNSYHPNPAELERLAFLNEEMAETAHALSKCIRHGFESVDPTLDLPLQITNREWLSREMGQVLAAMQLMVDALDVKEDVVFAAKEAKMATVGKWLHFQAGLLP